MSSTNDKLIQLAETKSLIKNAIINKGVEITPETPFRDYADKISEISSGGGEPVIKGYRQFERYVAFDVDENYIAKMTGNGCPKMNLIGSPYGTQFVVRVKVTDLHTDKQNILFGGNSYTFCVGTGASNLRLGIWLETNFGTKLQGGDGGNGQTNFDLELNKWYFLRFTYKSPAISGLPNSQALVELDIKEDNDDEYTNIYRTETLIRGYLNDSLTTAFFGGTFYGTGYFSKCEIDLKQSYAIQLNVPGQGFNPISVPY